MKTITIAGNLAKDATLRNTGKDDVLGFPVAVNDGYGESKKTIYFDCSLWGKRGEKLAHMLTKGAKICVSGELGTREHEGKTYLTIRVSDLTLMGGNKESKPEAKKEAPPIDDDVPF